MDSIYFRKQLSNAARIEAFEGCPSARGDDYTARPRSVAAYALEPTRRSTGGRMEQISVETDRAAPPEQ